MCVIVRASGMEIAPLVSDYTLKWRVTHEYMSKMNP